MYLNTIYDFFRFENDTAIANATVSVPANGQQHRSDGMQDEHSKYWQ